MAGSGKRFGTGKRGGLLVLAGLLLLGAGCRRAEGPAARPAAGVERTDATGTAVARPGSPGRVVSLLPSLTVSLQALGARDRLVGATRWCRVEEGPAVVRVGDMLRPDLEKIVSLRPDLVLASMEGSSQAHVEKLRAAGAMRIIWASPSPLLSATPSSRSSGTLERSTRAATTTRGPK